MEVRSIAFSWSINLSLESAQIAFAQVGLFPSRLKQHQWSRSYREHQLQVEHRPILSTKERSFFWLRWLNPKGIVDKAALDHLLSAWYFAMSQYADTNVNLMQAVVDLDVFHPPLGYKETSPKIWSKEEKQHRFSFFPVPRHYFFEVRNQNDTKTIQHHRFSFWLDELKYHVLGNERPDDQIMFDIVV